jgi:enamine deaminase RidA (YjgF/YER057c/UK114 family)
MSRKVILTEKAPPTRAGIYSQAIVAGNMVFCSGSLPVDPVTGTITEGGIQTRTVCLHLFVFQASSHIAPSDTDSLSAPMH